MKRLTIFTPTYNRAYILPKLYESLCVQTCKDFDWLIIDDGSTDNTRELVDGWMKDAKVPIRYYYQQNGGKMRAYNLAVEMTRSEFFVCIDSDDQLAGATVIADSLDFWDSQSFTGFPNDVPAERMVGWMSLRRMPGSPERVEKAPYCGKMVDMASAINGETTIFLRTDVLRQYPYWVAPSENFIPDSYIYEQIEENYDILFHPYYSQICQYQEEGLTNNWRRFLYKNPYSYCEFHAQRIRLKKRGWWKSVICYISISLYIGDGSLFRETPNRPITLLLFPVGCLKYLYDRYMLSKID